MAVEDGAFWLGVGGLLVAVPSLVVAVAAYRRDNRHHQEQKAEMETLRRSHMKVSVAGSRLYPPGQADTIFDVCATVTNEGYADDTLKSAFVEFPGWHKLTHFTTLARQDKPGILTFEPAAHDTVYARFKADGPFSFDLKKAVLGLEFVRAGLILTDFQAGRPGLPSKD